MLVFKGEPWSAAHGWKLVCARQCPLPLALSPLTAGKGHVDVESDGAVRRRAVGAAHADGQAAVLCCGDLELGKGGRGVEVLRSKRASAGRDKRGLRLGVTGRMS